MDELSGLIQQLQAEVGELDRALRLREAEEGQRLRAEEDRHRAAQQRLGTARGTLEQERAALTVLDARRAQLLARIEGWRGLAWRTGWGSAAMLTVLMAMTSFPVASVWLGREWAAGLAGAQVVLFLALYFLIPKKR